MSSIVRSTLLPPYMLDSPVWAELTDSIDAVFGPAIDDPTVWLSKLRDTWILTQAAEASIAGSSKLIDNTEFEAIEKNILIRQANMLGFDFADSDILSSTDYQRIVRNLSQYWYGKGTPQLQNFLGFVLNTVLTINSLWSTPGDTPGTYGPLLVEGDAGIGTPVWETGGTWFPTTHIQITLDPFVFTSVPISKLKALFYSLANYNLVLHSILFEGDTYVHSVDETLIGRIVCLTPREVIEQTISTV